MNCTSSSSRSAAASKAPGVARVTARYRDALGRPRLVTLVVKRLRGAAARELRNVVLWRRQGCDEPVLLDWGRARIGSPPEWLRVLRRAFCC